MTEKSRHGLHVVKDGAAPLVAGITRALPPPRGRATLSLSQQSAVLRVGGSLNADTSGRLRIFLSMFTVEHGPEELFLDLSEVYAVDEDGMAPIHEAEESMRLRSASLWLASMSAAVAHYLDDARCGRSLGLGPPPDVTSLDRAGEQVLPALDDVRRHPDQDRHDR
jgi:anti-anti-sigma regulatory factor